jgi:hypothetical protein
MERSVSDLFSEAIRLSGLLDHGLYELRQQSIALADAEEAYRRAKAEAWVRCPNDHFDVKAGEREWTAARREAWVNAETAGLRRARDLADLMRATVLEAVRTRRTQLSAIMTFTAADRAEAEMLRTGQGRAA